MQSSNLRTIRITLIILFVTLFLAIGLVMAQGRPWGNHAAPFDFYFGNNIDTHQQSQITGGSLTGFLYISYTGEYQNNIPVARQTDCSQNPDSCTIGWSLHGIPAQATLLSNNPRLWCVSPTLIPRQPGYTHFRWIGAPVHAHGLVAGQTYNGYLLKRTAHTSFYWLGGGSGGHGHLVTPGIDSQINITTDCSTGGNGGGGHDDGGCGGHDDGGCGGHDGG